MKKIISVSLVLLILCFSLCGCSLKKYVIAVDDSFKPFSFVDMNGKAAGFEVELIELIAKTEKIRIEIIPSGLLDGLEGLDNGDADAVIAAIIPTEEFCEKYDFSDPYFNDYALAVNKGTDSSFLKKFNNGLMKIIENGKYKELVDKYSLGDIIYE